MNRAHSTGPTLTPVVPSLDHLLICFPFWLIQDPPREDTIIQFVLTIKTSDIHKPAFGFRVPLHGDFCGHPVAQVQGLLKEVF